MRRHNHTTSQTTTPQDPEPITALNGWMQKHEQMIASLSGRLAVLETRLSLLTPLHEPTINDTDVGPFQRCLLEAKNHHKTNLRDWAKILDYDLAQLQASLQDHDRRLTTITDQTTILGSTLEKIQQTSTDAREQAIHTTRTLTKHLHHHKEPTHVMRLGRLELPMELNGILLALLAFTVAALILLGQKAILADPIFLIGIGVLFLATALLKQAYTKLRQSRQRRNQQENDPPTEIFDDTHEERAPASSTQMEGA
jgi:hypothetical protein